MDLRTRLARLDGLNRRPAGTGEPEDPVRTRILPSAEDLGMAALDPGSRVYGRQTAYPWPSPALVTSDLVGLFPTLPAEPLPASALLFLDTETTGLAGGTGTLAFLVGLAWWEGDRFVVEQILMSDPDGERRLLERVSAAAGGKEAVVTFNGASFDLPLLRTRGVLNRIRGMLSSLAGLDLVVPSRRLWSRTLPDCRQQTLETRICGLQRGPGDIDGRDIPAAWFAFLHGEDIEGMAAILEHNRRDMCGMARLWEQLGLWAAQVDGQEDSGPDPLLQQWSCSWSLARVAWLRGRRDRARFWLHEALEQLADEGGADEADRVRFLRDGVRLAKGLRDWPLLSRVLTFGLEALPGTPWLHREAAILHEHRLRNLDTALQHALQCGEQGRVGRLERRMGRRGLEPRPGGGS